MRSLDRKEQSEIDGDHQLQIVTNYEELNNNDHTWIK